MQKSKASKAWVWALGAAIILLDVIHSAHLPRRPRHSMSEGGIRPLAPGRAAAKVALVNTVPFHTEVYTALLYSFVRAGAEVQAFVDTKATAGMEHVIESWYTAPFQPHQGFMDRACDFDLVVFVTFPEHHASIMEKLAVLGCGGQRFAVVVHNPGGLDSLAVANVLGSLKATVLALAPHTAEAASRALSARGISEPAQLFVPVFPVDVADKAAAGEHEGRSFVLQGLFEPQRRNYSSIFAEIEREPALMRDKGFQLRLIGRGELAVPKGLAGKVVKEADLAYPDYYAAVRHARAVLPAFASDVYYTSKASSSVAAALICGTPLLANLQLLRAYSYLPPEATLTQEAGESEAAAMARILELPSEYVLQTAANVDEAREALYEQNDAVIAGMLRWQAADAGEGPAVGTLDREVD